MLDIELEISSYGHIQGDNDNRRSESEERAYQLYNHAIDDIKSGNSDIAFIKLKKAISIKNDLYDAKLLLGLYYIKVGNHSKATSVFEDVLKNDKDYGITALKYLRTLNAGIDRKEDKGRKGSIATKEDFCNEENNKRSKEKIIEKYLLNIDSKYKFIIVGIAIGLIIGLLITSILGNNKKSEIDQNGTTNNTTLVDSFDTIKILNDRIDELTNQISILDSELEILKSKSSLDDSERDQIKIDLLNDTRNQLNEYFNILSIYNSGDFLDSADKMKVFIEENTLFSGTASEGLETVYSNMLDKAARYCEDLGVSLFEQKKYEESMDILSKALEYRPDYSRLYRVEYYYGKDLLALGKYDQAKTKFLKVIEIAPNNDWIYYANLRLTEINKIQNN